MGFLFKDALTAMQPASHRYSEWLLSRSSGLLLNSLSRFLEMFLRILRGTAVSVAFVLLNAPFSIASQSSITQRFGFNSAEQLSLITSGSWGINDQTFVNGSFVYSKTPIPFTELTDTFYLGTVGAGYAVQNIAFDVAFQYSTSPLTKIMSLGGSLGITYIFIPEGASAEDYSKDALGALNQQIYEKNEEQPALFWLRAGYTGNTMTSGLVNFSNNRGQETSFTFDFFFPYTEELLLNAGVGFHGYDNSRGFFDKAFENMTTIEQALLQSTLQGLPRTTASIGGTWQLASRDAFLPRYQATEIDSSRTWAHTLNLGWRHQFAKAFYMTPIYEVSVQDAQANTGVVMELLFTF